MPVLANALARRGTLRLRHSARRARQARVESRRRSIRVHRARDARIIARPSSQRIVCSPSTRSWLFRAFGAKETFRAPHTTIPLRIGRSRRRGPSLAPKASSARKALDPFLAFRKGPRRALLACVFETRSRKVRRFLTADPTRGTDQRTRAPRRTVLPELTSNWHHGPQRAMPPSRATQRRTHSRVGTVVASGAPRRVG